MLAEGGWAVAVNHRSCRTGASAVMDEIRSAGGRAGTAPVDVTDPEAISTALERIAGSAALLASRRAGFIAGQRISVNGGRHVL